MIFITGISIAIFFEFLLIAKKNKSESDKILILWMFLISIHLFLFYMLFSEEIYNYSFLLGIEKPFPLLHGVLLYIYTASVTNQLPAKRKVLFLHFLPATVFYIYLITFFILPADEKIQVYKNKGAGYEVFLAILHYAFSFSGIIYVLWSGLLLRQHKQNILNQFSDLEKINLRWLQFLTLGLGCIWLFVIFFRSDIITFGALVIFIFLICFFGIRQVGIFTSTKAIREVEEQKEKYSKSGLKEELSEELFQKLKSLMTKDEMYKKNELLINDLAGKLDVHPNYLSQLINEREGKNFYDFVNNYRLEEFKRLIAIPKNQHLTLLSLAYECGFNSKSSFNRYFKKKTGQTPSQYFALITKA